MAMQDKPDTPVQNSEPAATARPVRNLEIKAALLLLFTGLLIAASVLYLLYARGVFQPTQTLVLMAEDSEGVVVGMDMTFSGFPIGRVRRVELAETGNVRIVIDVPKKDAHWLRTSSIFTLVRGLVGGDRAEVAHPAAAVGDGLLPVAGNRAVWSRRVGQAVRVDGEFRAHRDLPGDLLVAARVGDLLLQLARDGLAVIPTAIVVGVLAAVVQFLGLARWPFFVPALARALKHELEGVLGRHYAELNDLLGALRGRGVPLSVLADTDEATGRLARTLRRQAGDGWHEYGVYRGRRWLAGREREQLHGLHERDADRIEAGEDIERRDDQPSPLDQDRLVGGEKTFDGVDIDDVRFGDIQRIWFHRYGFLLIPAVRAAHV